MDINPSRVLFGSPIADNYNCEPTEIETCRNVGNTRTSEILNVMMDWVCPNSISKRYQAEAYIHQLLSENTDDLQKIRSFKKLKGLVDEQHKDKFQKHEVIENHFPIQHYVIKFEDNHIKNFEFKFSNENYLSPSQRIAYANNDNYTSALKQQILLGSIGKTDDDAIDDVSFKNLT